MNHFTSHKFQFYELVNFIYISIVCYFIIRYFLKIQNSNDHRYPLYRNKFVMYNMKKIKKISGKSNKYEKSVKSVKSR